MLAYIVIGIASTLTAGLTLYSGFGLGTLLMPVFALFFPIEIAVASTAVVHAANSVFKIVAVGKHADKTIIIKFGIPAILAASIGAYVLGHVSAFHEVVSYSISGHRAVITPIKLTLCVLMIFFALFELLPSLRNVRFDHKHLLLGGLLSGFFGGLSGHQGALRSAFLVKTGISTQSFVGTNAIIGFMVDMVRISIYVVLFFFAQTTHPIPSGQYPLILTAIVAAFVGVFSGKRLLHSLTMQTVTHLTSALLLCIALLLGLGLI